MSTMNLDRREKSGLILGVVALTAAVLLALYIPAGPRKTFVDSERKLDNLRDELVMAHSFLQMEKQRLEEQEELMRNIESRSRSFELFSYVNDTLRETNLWDRAQLDNDNSRRASPKRPSVKLRLDGVNLQELIDFLHKIYASNNVVAVEKMDRLEPVSNERGLECIMTLVTIKK
jgi:hypothetical protein